MRRRKCTEKRRKDRIISRRQAFPVAASPDPTPPGRTDRFLTNAIWYAAAILVFWSFGYTEMRGSDLWWHLASGRLMWEQGSIPGTDPWSFSQMDNSWMHHEWLSDVLYHLWTKAFGMASLVWWKWMVVVLTFLVLMRTLHRLTGSLPAAFAGSVAAAAVAAPFLDIRPQLYSLLGTVILLRLCLVPPRPTPLLPLLFLAWVNLHSGAFFGIMALWIIVAASVIFSPGPLTESEGNTTPRRYRTCMIFLGLGCTLICLANPNGLEPFAYPLRYAFSSTSVYRTLGEWLPPFQPGGIQSPLYPLGIGLFIASALAVGISGLWRQDRRLALSAVALGTLTLAMSLKARRFVPLFMILSSLTVAQALGLLFPFAGRPLGAFLQDRLGRRIPHYLLPLLALAFGIFRLAPYPRSSDAFLYLTAEDTFPVETCNFIETNKLGGKVFAYYNWGGYLHLRTNGTMKVYIDGRADTIFDDQTYVRYVHVLTSGAQSVRIIEDSGAQWVLWPKEKEKLIRTLLRTGRWKPVYHDAVSFLLARDGTPLPDSLGDTADSAYRRILLADFALSRGNLAEAEAHLRRALEYQPNLGLACYRLAGVQASQGNTQAARGTLLRCREIFPNPWKQAHYRRLIEERDPSDRPSRPDGRP